MKTKRQFFKGRQDIEQAVSAFPRARADIREGQLVNVGDLLSPPYRKTVQVKIGSDLMPCDQRDIERTREMLLGYFPRDVRVLVTPHNVEIKEFN